MHYSFCFGISSRIILRFSLLFSSFLTFGQGPEDQQGIESIDNTVNIVPPSPTAASLGKYGEYKVGGSTGVPSISIPLFDVKGTSMSIPISLSYHGSGVRVDDIASWVGMGWSLNAGGVITRNIVGYPDESSKGLFTLYKSFEFNPPIYDDTHYNLGWDMLYRLSSGLFKGEPDTYSYNFLGYSGQFYIDHNEVIHHFSDTDLAFSRVINSNGEIPQFKVVVGDGTTLVFSAVEYASYDTGEQSSYSDESAWYVTSITKGDDTFSFNYRDEGINEGYSCSEVGVARTLPAVCIQGFERKIVEGGIASKQSKKLTSIEGPFGTAVFHATEARLDLPGGKRLETITYQDQEINLRAHYTEGSYARSINCINLVPGAAGLGIRERLFLDEVEISAGTNKKKYFLEYDNPDGLPPTKAFDKDHWGYFNEAKNYTLLPKSEYFESGGNRDANPETMGYGMLNKITYPTGGFTKFDWEPNRKTESITGEVETCSNLVSEIFSHDDPNPFRAYEVRSWEIDIENITKLKFWLNVGFAYEVESEPGDILLEIRQGDNPSIYKRNFEPDDTEPDSVMNVAPGVYTISLKNRSPLLDQVRFVLDKCHSEVRTYPEHTYYGGLRVDKVTNYSSETDEFNSISYDYGRVTSSRSINDASYLRTIRKICESAPGVPPVEAISRKRHSNTVNQFSTSVTYDLIHEIFLDGSQNLYRYDQTQDVFAGNGYTRTLIQDQSWKRNLLLEFRSINSDGVTVSSKQSQYSFIRKNIYHGIKVDIISWYPLNLGNSDHEYGIGLIDIYSDWARLDYTIETTNYPSGSVSSRTDYEYFHPDFHLKPNKISLKRSDGGSASTVILYPRNYSNDDDEWNSLKQFYFEKPIESVSYLSNENDIIGGVLLDYNPNGTLKSQSKIDLNESIEKSSFLFSNGNTDPSEIGLFSKKTHYVGTEANIAYDGYRLKNVLDRSGVPITYLWGYGNRYPIAKIENITSDDLNTLVGNWRVEQLKNSSDNNFIRSQLSTVRNLLPLKSQMTSYIYKYGIGVAEISDPNGRTATFSYDDFGRLTAVTDHEGNLITEYEYLYALETE
ncbi:RHS repeat domain-containing protein [Ekhidna sp.]